MAPRVGYIGYRPPYLSYSYIMAARVLSNLTSRARSAKKRIAAKTKTIGRI